MWKPWLNGQFQPTVEHNVINLENSTIELNFFALQQQEKNSSFCNLVFILFLHVSWSCTEYYNKTEEKEIRAIYLEKYLFLYSWFANQKIWIFAPFFSVFDIPGFRNLFELRFFVRNLPAMSAVHAKLFKLYD